MKRRLAIIGMAVACALLFVLQVSGWPHSFCLVLDVKTERCVRLLSSYDAPLESVAVDEVMRTIDSRAHFKTVRFPVAAETIRSLRLLTSPNSSGRIRLRHVRIEIPGLRAVSILPTQLAPIISSASIKHKGEVTMFDAAASGGVTLQLTHPMQTSKLAWIAHWGIVAALCFSSAALLVSLRRWGFPENSPMFERRIGNAFVVLTTALFLVATALKLNGSATSFWQSEADRRAPGDSVLAGQPKELRSDEWMVHTPWIMSQARRVPSFPADNPNVGDGRIALLNNLPVRHWSVLFRPQMWGFFVAPFEYAFAFYWNCKWFGMLLGGFLLLRCVSFGRSSVAIFGTLLFYFSPFIQWWFSTPTGMPEMLGLLFFGLWAVVVIQRTKSRAIMIASAALLLSAIANFIFCSYPRFQIPLLWLVLFIIAGRIAEPGSELRRWRRSVLALTSAAAVVLLLSWFWEIAPLLRATSQLIYPGQIVSVGGGIPWRAFFAPFLEFSVREEHFLRTEMNACNASGFLFFAPLLAVVIFRPGRADRLLWLLVLYILLVIGFMHFGVALALAKWTGFSLVYALLANLGVALASVIALCRLLAREPDPQRSGDVLRWLALALALIALFYFTNESIGRFINLATVVATGVFFSLAFLCLYRRQSALAAILFLLPLVSANAPVNPVVRGLRGISGSGLFRELIEVERRQPEGNWIVLGTSNRSVSLTHLIRATGANVLGGTRCNPDPAMLRVLDPMGKYAEITNRFAWVSFEPTLAVEASFNLTFINAYRVHLPLQPLVFDQLKVTKILEVDLPEATNRIPGFAAVKEYEGSRFLLRQSDAEQ